MSAVAVPVSGYSQHDEERAILRWAGETCGSFVDLGAYDGASYSNTAALAALGWPGICVDAAPDAAAASATRYAGRPDVDVVLAAFDPTGGTDPVCVYWTPAHMYSALERTRRNDVVITPILVPRLDLAWLKRRFVDLSPPLFCSIDLEGGSITALRWMLEHAYPACVCVEANTPVDSAEAARLLDGWDLLAENASNAVYARRS